MSCTKNPEPAPNETYIPNGNDSLSYCFTQGTLLYTNNKEKINNIAEDQND